MPHKAYFVKFNCGNMFAKVHTPHRASYLLYIMRCLEIETKREEKKKLDVSYSYRYKIFDERRFRRYRGIWRWHKPHFSAERNNMFTNPDNIQMARAFESRVYSKRTIRRYFFEYSKRKKRFLVCRR